MDAAPPPSFGFSLFAAALPAALWCCLLSPFALLWWMPWSIVLSYVKEIIPDAIPIESLLHLYAAYDSIVEAGWTSWWSTILGTLILQKAMGLSHEAVWDAFEPFVVGRKGHGAGTQRTVAKGRKPDMLDKDGQPLGAQTVLVPGTQLRVDRHDGRGFQPFVIPGEPVFTNERKAIEAFFTKDELEAMRSANVRCWDNGAQALLPKERAEQIRDTHGLWRES